VVRLETGRVDNHDGRRRKQPRSGSPRKATPLQPGEGPPLSSRCAA
jgi:hypothetical protein